MTTASPLLLAASFVGWPLTIVVSLSVPALILKLAAGVKIPIAWFVSMLAIRGLATPVGIGLSAVGFLLPAACLFVHLKPLSRGRMALLAVFTVVGFACLTYGLWFTLTRQGDTMF